MNNKKITKVKMIYFSLCQMKIIRKLISIFLTRKIVQFLAIRTFNLRKIHCIDFNLRNYVYREANECNEDEIAMLKENFDKNKKGNNK